MIPVIACSSRSNNLNEQNMLHSHKKSFFTSRDSHQISAFADLFIYSSLFFVVNIIFLNRNIRITTDASKLRLDKDIRSLERA